MGPAPQPVTGHDLTAPLLSSGSPDSTQYTLVSSAVTENGWFRPVAMGQGSAQLGPPSPPPPPSARGSRVRSSMPRMLAHETTARPTSAASAITPTLVRPGTIAGSLHHPSASELA